MDYVEGKARSQKDKQNLAAWQRRVEVATQDLAKQKSAWRNLRVTISSYNRTRGVTSS